MRAKVLADQYRTSANLAARQSIFAYRSPRTDFRQWVLELLALDGFERIVDVGCGNGAYLATLRHAGHRGPILALDLSEGMLHDTIGLAHPDGAVRADAAAAPLRDGGADVVLAMHMLYHLPDLDAAAHELRRLVRDGGTLVASTSSRDSLRELDRVWVGVAEDLTGVTLPRVGEMLSFALDDGDVPLRTAFEHVERHELAGRLLITDADAVVGYVDSLPGVSAVFPEADARAQFLSVVRARATEVIALEGALRTETLTGCFVCR